ncbi:class I SAM-dependent methyltransferase [Actinocrispum wychmicini]|uniref:Ubiquinone/menaquinone biosynthesis C-methylase UbiE n=1 Tax=Actinocrispum wychmicini TaxID=1213861 RepID=A0A4R2J8K2_9PSEU|nr:class I SAM-dependent methyltransferase [Actinocrispum wychmicini]TCO54052.1 ubiquinone/menaquinone biosynthesis C-methylase UbiE [Actinocrispum wychmicini]
MTTTDAVGEYTPNPQDVGIAYDQFADLHSLIASDVSLHMSMFTLPGERRPATTLLELANLTQEKTIAYHINTLGLKANEHLLDIGCRSGVPAIRFAQQTGAQVTGIDVSNSQIAKAVELAKEGGVADRTAFSYGDAMAMEFADESFDAALSLEVFCHLSDRQKGYDEAFRVLRPGSQFLVSDFVLRGTPSAEQMSAYQQTWHTVYPTTPAKIMELAANAGFELTKVEDMTQNVAFIGELMGHLYARNKDQIVEAYGAELVAGFDPVMPLIRDFFHDHLGSYLFLLRKPR